MPGIKAIQTARPGTIAAQTATGVVWVVAWRIASRILGLASSLLLIRLLTPTDFGLVALAFSISQSIELLSVFGIEDAVVRHQAPGVHIYNTAFTLNVIRSGVTALLIALLAWPMSVFFSEPRLIPIVASLALSTLLSGAGNIGVVDFRRNLTYQYEFRLRLIPRLASIAMTITVAVLFRSYWAIIVGTLTERLAMNVMTYRLHPHRPRFTLIAWRELMSFSLWLWVSGLVVMVRDRTGTFVIGHVLGVQAVGKLSIAIEIAITPLTEFMFPLASVLFPAFSRSAQSSEDTRTLYLRSMQMSMLVMVPAGVGMALVADPLVHLVLGPKWLETIPIIQLAAVFSPLTTFSFVSRALFEARGLMRSSFIVTAITTVLRVLLCVGFAYWLGLLGVVLAAVCTDTVEQISFLTMTCRRFQIGLGSLAARIWRPVAAALVMSAGIVALGLRAAAPHAGNAEMTLQLVLAVLTGAGLFILSLLTLWLLSGRPKGAETDALTALTQLAVSFRDRLNQSARTARAFARRS